VVDVACGTCVTDPTGSEVEEGVPGAVRISKQHQANDIKLMVVFKK